MSIDFCCLQACQRSCLGGDYDADSLDSSLREFRILGKLTRGRQQSCTVAADGSAFHQSPEDVGWGCDWHENRERDPGWVGCRGV